MTRQILLEEIKDDGKVEVGVLQSGSVIIGREPEEGIAIDNASVSRQHAAFMRIRSHWFLRDLGSTNGTWLNGDKLSPNEWKIVRPGDVVQVSTVLLRLSVPKDVQQLSNRMTQGIPALGGRSLIVFTNGEFLDEFPVPEVGRALLVGGPDSDLAVTGDLALTPILEIDRNPSGLIMKKAGKVNQDLTTLITLNGQEVRQTAPLADRDEVTVGPFVVLCNDPTGQLPRAAEMIGMKPVEPLEPQDGLSTTRSIKWDWNEAADDSAERAAKIAQQMRPAGFGQMEADSEEDEESTVSLSKSELNIAAARNLYQPIETHPSGRRSGPEEKVILVVGFALLSALVGMLGYWLVVK